MKEEKDKDKKIYRTTKIISKCKHENVDIFCSCDFINKVNFVKRYSSFPNCLFHTVFVYVKFNQKCTTIINRSRNFSKSIPALLCHYQKQK